MKPVDRQKMCANCDGRIPYEATQCPYCFTTLPGDSASSKIFTSSQENLTSLYNPPYQSEKTATPKETAVVMEKTEETKSFWPILLLTLAGNLFTLGILQFFFSDHGTVRLEVNGSYWFLLILASVPMFYFGLKKAD